MIDSKDLRVLDSSELRIGNLVLDSTKNTTKIESIIPEHNRVRYGIKLTEHWLERFGFEKVEQIKSYYWRKSLISCYKQDGTFWFDVIQGCVEIQYVHQLQNLFYSLTGKEIELTKQ